MGSDDPRDADETVAKPRLSRAEWPLIPRHYIAGEGLSLRLWRTYRSLAEQHSALLDREWYLAAYPDVAESGIDPLVHYVAFGVGERRHPSAVFDPGWYLAAYPDVAESGIDPLAHYVAFGAAEGRRPSAVFDPCWYLAAYPDVAGSGMDPLAHYVAFGAAEGRRPSAVFDPCWYVAAYPDVAGSGMDPLAHYVALGAGERRRPSPVFDPEWYAKTYPDVDPSGMDPLGHYVAHGAGEGRRPSPVFDPGWYARAYPDVDTSWMDPLGHYVAYGAGEGRRPSPVFDPDWYRWRHGDVDASGLDPLGHYVAYGAGEGRRPSPVFDPGWYAEAYPDVDTSWMDPLGHYVAFGAGEGRRPSAVFDPDWYRWRHGDVDASGMGPLGHYVAFGAAEGRRPSAVGGDAGTRGSVVLVLEWVMPTPHRDSGSLRLATLISMMRSEGNTVLLGAVNEGADSDYVDVLRSQGVYAVAGLEAVCRMVQTYRDRVDVVWLARPDTGAQLLPLVQEWCPDAKLVYDSVDIHWLRLKRQASFDDRVTKKDVTRQKRVERTVMAAADVVLAVTGDDADCVRRELPGKPVLVVPNIHVVRSSVRKFGRRDGIVFVGGFAHAPNVDAVTYFLTEVFGRIRKQVPDVSFHIVGSDMERHLDLPATPGVEPVGYVEDLEEYLDHRLIMVAPLRYGAGMKGKIGSAMSCGLPVVTTRIGAEGMGLVHGRTALVAQGPKDFADCTVRLHRDRRLWNRLSSKAMSLVSERYSPHAVSDVLGEALDGRR